MQTAYDSSLCICHVALIFTAICVLVPSTPHADCETGELQLANSTDDPLQNTTRGTLQICINHAWGGVCNDDLFGIDDAQVACQQAGGYERQVVGDIESVASVEPMFLSELGCEGDEHTLLECRRYVSIGSECVSNQVPVITCKGMCAGIVHTSQNNYFCEDFLLV